jgi:hypothetical protein
MAKVTVTGTVTDASAQAFANGTYLFTFAPAAGNPGPYYFGGAVFPINTSYTGSLDSSGAFSVSMEPNNQITPLGSQWIFKFLPAADAPSYQVQLPINTAGSITSSITPPTIQVQGSLQNQPKAYTDAEIVSPLAGFVYYNLTSNALRVYTSSGTWSAVGGASATQTIASGTAALGTSAISSNTAATVVTVAATGVLTTDTIMADFNQDPTAITGYIPGTMLTIVKYPTVDNVNFKVVNNTASSITPSPVTLNWRVVR